MHREKKPVAKSHIGAELGSIPGLSVKICICAVMEEAVVRNPGPPQPTAPHVLCLANQTMYNTSS